MEEDEEDAKGLPPPRASSRFALPPASLATLGQDAGPGAGEGTGYPPTTPRVLAAELKERLKWLRSCSGQGGGGAGGAGEEGGLVGAGAGAGAGGLLGPPDVGDAGDAVATMSEVELLMSLMPAPGDCVDVSTLRDAVNLVPSLHELFNHYSPTVAVSAKRRDGTSVTFDAVTMDLNAFVNQTGAAGPVVHEQDFFRMLHDYGVVPKLVSYTVRGCPPPPPFASQPPPLQDGDPSSGAMHALGCVGPYHALPMLCSAWMPSPL